MNIYFSIIPETKNPTNVGLDVVIRVNLLKQYHLLYLPEVSCLYCIQVQTSRYWLICIISSVPLDTFIACVLLTADQIVHYSTHHVVHGNIYQCILM